jgi:hypothetical protein
MYIKEIDELSNNALIRPIAKYTRNISATFSFDSLRADVEQHAPTLCQTLDKLVESRHRNNPGTDAVDESQSSNFGEVALPQRSVSKSYARNRKMMVSSIISHICYAHTRRANHLQGQMGLWLYAMRVPKRVLPVINALGISIGYESVMDALEAISEDCTRELKRIAATKPAMFVSFDNLNFYAKVQDQRVDNSHHGIINYTAGYVAMNRNATAKEMFSKRDLDYSALQKIEAMDFIPTAVNDTQWKRAFESAIYNTTTQHFSDALGKYKNGGERLAPFSKDCIYALPAVKTIIIPLKTFDKNEAQIREMTEILREITTELGYTREELIDKIILFKGDLLTIRNIR